MKHLKFILWLSILWLSSFNYSSAIDFTWITTFVEPIANFFVDVNDFIWSIFDFIWWLIKFIGAALKLLFFSLINLIDHVTGVSWMTYLSQTFLQIQTFLWIDIIYFELALFVCICLVIYRFVLRLFSTLWLK